MLVLEKGHYKALGLSILAIMLASQPFMLILAAPPPFPFLRASDAMIGPLEFKPWGEKSNHMNISISDIDTEPIYKIMGKTGAKPAGFSAEARGNWTSLLINILNVTKFSDNSTKEDNEVQVFFTFYLEQADGRDKYVSYVDGPVYRSSGHGDYSYEQIMPGYYLINLEKYVEEGFFINRVDIGIQKQSIIAPIEFSVQFW